MTKSAWLHTCQGVTFGYDHANRRTSLVLPNGINVAYGYDIASQLTSISYVNVTATFAYDGQGRRRARTVSGATTHFLYDGQQPIQELTRANVLSAALLTGGIDEIFSRSAGAVLWEWRWSSELPQSQ